MSFLEVWPDLIKADANCGSVSESMREIREAGYCATHRRI